MPDGQRKMDYILDRVDSRYANLELDVLYLNAANHIPVREYMTARVTAFGLYTSRTGISTRAGRTNRTTLCAPSRCLWATVWCRYRRRWTV